MVTLKSKTSKTYHCSCVYHKGKHVRCEITTGKSEIPTLCPYDMGEADWREFVPRIFYEFSDREYHNKTVNKKTDRRFKKKGADSE